MEKQFTLDADFDITGYTDKLEKSNNVSLKDLTGAYCQVGSPAIDRASSYNDVITVINLNSQVTVAGTLTQVDIFGSVAGNVQIKIFRDDGTNYVFVGESEIFAITTGFGTYILGTPITGVQVGDYIGVCCVTAHIDGNTIGGTSGTKFKLAVNVSSTQLKTYYATQATGIISVLGTIFIPSSYATDSPQAKLIEAGQTYSIDAGPGKKLNISGFTSSETVADGSDIKYRYVCSASAEYPAGGWSGWLTQAEMAATMTGGYRYLYIEVQFNSDGASDATLSDATITYITQDVITIKIINENVDVTETAPKLKSIIKMIAESLGITETTVRHSHLLRIISETLGVADSMVKIFWAEIFFIVSSVTSLMTKKRVTNITARNTVTELNTKKTIDEVSD